MIKMYSPTGKRRGTRLRVGAQFVTAAADWPSEAKLILHELRSSRPLSPEAAGSGSRIIIK